MRWYWGSNRWSLERKGAGRLMPGIKAPQDEFLEKFYWRLFPGTPCRLKHFQMSFHLCKLSKKVEHRDFCNLDFFRKRQVVGTSSLRRYPSTEKELRPSSRWPGSIWRQAVWIYSSVLVCLTEALEFALVLFSKYHLGILFSIISITNAPSQIGVT